MKKKFLLTTLCLSLCISSAVPTMAAKKTTNYVDWAVSIANDDSHGYSMYNRNGKPDYDNSSFVAAALKKGGYKVSMKMYTGDEVKRLTKIGFTKIKYSKKKLKTGDILWRKGHTEIYIGKGKMVGAHCSETGGKTGKAGDQTGKEISVTKNTNNWTYILRPSK